MVEKRQWSAETLKQEMKNEKHNSENRRLHRSHRHRNFCFCGRSSSPWRSRTVSAGEQRRSPGNGYRQSRGEQLEYPSRTDHRVHRARSGRISGTGVLLSAGLLLLLPPGPAASPAASMASWSRSPRSSWTRTPRTTLSWPRPPALTGGIKKPTLERAGIFHFAHPAGNT